MQAQKIQLNSGRNSISEWERILSLKNSLVSDTTALKNFLQPLEDRNSESDKVLYNVLLANCYAKAFDRINKKSNQYYSKSIISAQKSGDKALEIWATLCNAEYFYNYREITKSLPFFVAAIEKIDQTDPSQILFPGESFTKIGFYMGTIGDNNEAINYLKKAIKYTNTNTPEFARITDNLGLYYLQLGDVINARKNIEKASEVAKSVGDSVRYAKTLGNLGLIYEKEHDYPNAIKIVREDIQISERFKCEQNVMFAYTILARLLIANDQILEADIVLKKADLIAKSKSYFKINELEILKLKLEIIYKQNKGRDELGVRRRIGILEDSLNKTDGILPLNQANWMMQKRNYQQNIASTKQELSKELFWKNLIFIASGLLILFVLFIIFKSKKTEKIRKTQNDNKIEEYEKTKASNEQKLADAHKTLDSQIDFLKEKNIQIQKLHLEIEKFRKTDSSFEQDHGKLDNLLQSHLMTEENWRNFKSEFQREHPDFYDNLLQNFPEITDSNLRIILLQKLGFTNTEISGLLGITVEAVKKSKQRLKRKLGDKYDLLFQMIAIEN
ncbi:tetratricopeptide repeat protein [Kaistella jeonii]|uniref:tetratricopeptide repeat protein n=1 Tax=Kaistella jeonii TaxID=266749 RepID=UPI000AC04F7B|nr:tetratricopeptide repeat protein [Kaistella jeonii]